MYICFPPPVRNPEETMLKYSKASSLIILMVSCCLHFQRFPERLKLLCQTSKSNWPNSSSFELNNKSEPYKHISINLLVLDLFCAVKVCHGIAIVRFAVEFEVSNVSTLVYLAMFMVLK